MVCECKMLHVRTVAKLCWVRLLGVRDDPAFWYWLKIEIIFCYTSLICGVFDYYGSVTIAGFKAGFGGWSLPLGRSKYNICSEIPRKIGKHFDHLITFESQHREIHAHRISPVPGSSVINFSSIGYAYIIIEDAVQEDVLDRLSHL